MEKKFIPAPLNKGVKVVYVNILATIPNARAMHIAIWVFFLLIFINLLIFMQK